ncbi:MAG: TraR/DksA C4-type zinc finger protein [Candidatus Cloacimonetes bacterium]|nr:TraR/DksA C4-type zinc finger protein [Candidatus Cloacimonadota bacterium]
MAEKDLSNEILDEYKQVLLIEKEKTESLINKINDIQKRNTEERSGDTSSYTLHQADMGTDTSESERRVYILEKEIVKLKKINVALHRIYDKTYGICLICGQYIPEKRLKIVPYAKYCIDCKNTEELNNNKKRR